MRRLFDAHFLILPVLRTIEANRSAALTTLYASLKMVLAQSNQWFRVAHITSNSK
jgi:hypothetical protein